MSATPELVWQGSNGSRHFLFSSPDHSVLVIVCPVRGVEKYEFAGPLRLTSSGEDGATYRCVDAEGTTDLYLYADPTRSPYRTLLGGIDIDAVTASWVAAAEGRDDAFSPVPVEPEPERNVIIDTPLDIGVEPEPAPEPVKKRRKSASAAPEPPPVQVPVVSPAVESTARTLAIQVRNAAVKRRSDFYAYGTPTGDTEAWIAHAVAMQWVVEDGDVLRRGPVDPEPLADMQGDAVGVSAGGSRWFGLRG